MSLSLHVRAVVVAVVACNLLACQTIHVRTTPEDADVEVDGEPLADTHEYKEGVGLSAHKVVVRKEGYQPANVKVARDRMVPWLKWTALVGALGCATASSFCAATAGVVLCNRNVPLSLVGYSIGTLIGLGGSTPVEAVVAVAVVQGLSPDILMVPGMALLGLLGAWPLLGLLVPVLFPRSAGDVEVVLQRQGAPVLDPSLVAPAPGVPAPAEPAPPPEAPATSKPR